jgi:transcriptional regulator with XRE-family HTH domain
MTPPDQSQPRRVAPGRAQLHQRRSLQAANEVSLQLSGNQVGLSQDPQGQRLRQIRKAQGLDPARVATEACISLGQLYELETGGRRLFYSDTLRQQAGRRVATILGSDWDALACEAGICASAPSIPTSAEVPQGFEPVNGPASERGTATAQPSSGDQAQVSPTTAEAGSSPPAHSPEPQTSVHTAERVLRGLVWILMVLVLVLAAARMGWVPGLHLPLSGHAGGPEGIKPMRSAQFHEVRMKNDPAGS